MSGEATQMSQPHGPVVVLQVPGHEVIRVSGEATQMIRQASLLGLAISSPRWLQGTGRQVTKHEANRASGEAARTRQESYLRTDSFVPASGGSDSKSPHPMLTLLRLVVARRQYPRVVVSSASLTPSSTGVSHDIPAPVSLETNPPPSLRKASWAHLARSEAGLVALVWP